MDEVILENSQLKRDLLTLSTETDSSGDTILRAHLDNALQTVCAFLHQAKH